MVVIIVVTFMMTMMATIVMVIAVVSFVMGLVMLVVVMMAGLVVMIPTVIVIARHRINDLMGNAMSVMMTGKCRPGDNQPSCGRSDNKY